METEWKRKGNGIICKTEAMKGRKWKGRKDN